MNKGHPTYQEDGHLATFPMGDVARNSKASTNTTKRQSKKELSQAHALYGTNHATWLRPPSNRCVGKEGNGRLNVAENYEGNGSIAL